MKQLSLMIGLAAALSCNFRLSPDDGASLAGGTATAEADAFDGAAPSSEAGAGESSDDAAIGASGTATGTGPKTKPKTGAAVVEGVQANTELVTLLQTYDELKNKTISVYVDMAELVAKENISRPIVLKSIMEARGTSYESAQSMASRVMSLAKDPDTIGKLRRGEVTTSEVFYKRAPGGSKVGSSPGGQTDPANVGGGAKGEKQPETKEKKYARILGEFVEVAKASGYDRKSILMGVEASLKNAGIK
jgi:hypothetical protein